LWALRTRPARPRRLPDHFCGHPHVHSPHGQPAPRAHEEAARGGREVRQQFTMRIPTELTISNNRTAQLSKRKKVKGGIQALTRDAAKGRYPGSKASRCAGKPERT